MGFVAAAKRKVIQLAGKTLVVSLPSKWARRMGIRKGDELEIEEKDNKLALSTTKQTQIEAASFDATNSSVPLSWSIGSMYKSGYDEITVSYEKPETAKELHEITKDLFIGFAVTEQARNRIVLRAIAKEMESEFDSILRRAFLVTLSLGEGLVEYLDANKTGELAGLIVLEKTNNQLTNFCERILIKKGFREYRKTCFAYVIVWNLEKVCDNYKYMINHILSAKTAVKKETVQLIEKANKLLRGYYELHYKFDSENLNELVAERKQLEKDAKESLEKQTTDAVVISYVMQIAMQVSDFTGPIIAVNTG
ncbi:MAG: AbrB/MazE/SpoVT family DNA-binding domain-containing protein [Thaumarchaeota archaeon]|nr:AbrB/MazE/SpoVT family DNA-binding domain-containing protein [Nitrososphaerota archaeon]